MMKKRKKILKKKKKKNIIVEQPKALRVKFKLERPLRLANGWKIKKRV